MEVGWALVLWGSPQEHVSICPLDRIEESWYLGLGGGLALKIEGQARSNGVKPMDVGGVSQGT